MTTVASQKPMDEALHQIRKHIDYLEFFIVQKVDREKKAQAKHLAHFFDGNEEFSFAVDAHSRFKHTNLFTILTRYNLSVVTFFQIWKYCNLLVEDAVFSQPYFYSDSAVIEYLSAKICGERFIDAVKFRSWLLTKRSLSKEAKSRGKLLGKKYRSLMQNCIHNWTSLFFNPNIQSVLYAGKQK